MGLKKLLVIGGLVGGAIMALTKTKKGREIAKEIEVEVQTLYRSLRTDLKSMGKVSRKNFDQAVDELIKRYDQEKKITQKTKNQMSRALKAYWADFTANKDGGGRRG